MQTEQSAASKNKLEREKLTLQTERTLHSNQVIQPVIINQYPIFSLPGSKLVTSDAYLLIAYQSLSRIFI